MSALKKINGELYKVVSLNCKTFVDCIVYVTDLGKAKNFFKKEEIIKELPFISALALKIDSTKLLESCRLNWVKSVTGQAKVLALIDVSKKILGVDGSLTGKDITIAYIDTGISSHLDFTIGQNRIIKFVDLVNKKIKNYDDNGHGTFVSGVGSGSGFLSGGKLSGIAPKSNIVSIKALNENGEANAITILDAMQWVFDNAKKFNIKVVCMSFGSEPLGASDPIMKGAEVLWNKGIVVVAAAGNSGPEFETIKSPGVSSKIITVGGLCDNRNEIGEINKKDFSIANFSSRGPALRRFKPDLVAPSVNIKSCSNLEAQNYVSMSGTSVATPMIAGISALLLEKKPNLSPDQVKQILISNCKAVTHNRNLEGFGYPCFKA